MKKLILACIFLIPSLAARIQQINPDIINFAANGDVKRVKSLVEDEGVDINITNEDGRTALVFAAELNQPKVVKYLVDNGANPNIAIIGDPSVCTGGDIPDEPVACADLMPGAPFPFKDHEGWTALHFAASKDIADILVGSGALVDKPDKHGMTPLMVFVKKGDLPTIKLLIRRGANVNAKRGATVNAKKETDRTALFYAVAYADQPGNDRLAIIKELINNGAVVTDTILMKAEQRKSSKKVTQILTTRPSRGLKKIIGM